MNRSAAVIRRSREIELTPSHRPGIAQAALISREDSLLQNLVLAEFAEGARVEMHEVGPSESFYVLRGAFELRLADETVPIGPGDVTYFGPNTAHGLVCTEGPGRILVVFAPSREVEKGTRTAGHGGRD